MARWLRVYCVTIGWAFVLAQTQQNTGVMIAGTVVNSATGQPSSATGATAAGRNGRLRLILFRGG